MRTLLIVMLGLAVPLLAQTDNSQMSLAERAAAARRGTVASKPDAGLPPLTPEQRGKIESGKYINEFLHFQMVPPRNWDILSAGQMNVSEALGRSALNLHGAFGGEEYRVLGMHDGTGRSEHVSIIPIPPGETRTQDEILAKIKQNALAKLPSAKELPETIFFGDGKHLFSACRMSFPVENFRVTQTLEILRVNNFLVTISVTTDASQDLTALLKALKTKLVFQPN